MGFAKGKDQDQTNTIVKHTERIVETPVFKEIIVEKPVYRDVVIERPVYQDRKIEVVQVTQKVKEEVTVVAVDRVKYST